MVSFARELRGVPLWLLREYLLELGGWGNDDFQVQGAGWQARLIQLEDFKVGALVVGEVRLEVDGDAESMACLLPKLEKKLLRAGG